jgi:hypothetical protein
MQTYSNKALLEDLHKQTELILDKAVREWQMMSPVKFSRQPQDGGWSAAQCLDHLNGYGRYYLPLLAKAITNSTTHGPDGKTFIPGWLGSYFTNLMEPGPDGTVTRKMKSPKPNIPPSDVNSDEVIAAFIEQQEQLLQLLNKAISIDLNRREIPISILKAVRLKTGDVFRFLIAHNRRHVAQAERALGVFSTAFA